MATGSSTRQASTDFRCVIIADLRAAYRYAIGNIACSRGQSFRYGADWDANKRALEERLIQSELREIRLLRKELETMGEATYERHRRRHSSRAGS